MSINVNPNAEDAFYRYKMPRLIAKVRCATSFAYMPLLQLQVEGKGNGIKTVIPNMTEIAKALNRPPNC